LRRFFFDTSALLKIYHREEGTDSCLDIFNSSDEITISELARVEMHSTLYRKHREGNLKAKALDAVLKRFSSDQENRFEVLDITSLVFDEACRLLAVHSRKLSLRTLDSLQAAAFLTYCEIGQDSFVCADRKLADVVSLEGAGVLLVGL
jgi:predicted nucleic acid-binding protein